MEPISASAARLAGSSLLRVQSDERLAKLASLGNETAFEVLVRRYRRELIRACSRILDGAAEDAVQQALLKAHRALLRNGPPDRFRPWLHKIAVNSALDLLGHEADTVPIDESVDGVEPPDAALERRDRVRRTVGAISDLPDTQRRALVLRELEGRSHEEIARELGLSTGAARQLIYRARNSVRSAASALTPPALLLRLLGPGAAESARPVAEIAAGGAAGGFAGKAAVTAIVAGGLAGAAAVGPPDRSNDGGEPDRPQAAAPREHTASSGDGSGTGPGESSGGRSGESGHSGPGGGEGSGNEGHGSGDDGDSGGGHSGPGGVRSADGDSDLEADGDSSGPGGGGGDLEEGELDVSSSGSGSSGSGLDSSGSGSGSSGSGSSGSGSSGSGSSGSGSITTADSGISDTDLDSSGSSGSG